MAPSYQRNEASDRDSGTRERSRGSHNQNGQPLWLSWVQLGISTMLVVLFLVMLGKVRPHESLACRRARPPSRRGRSGGGGGRGEARLVPFAAPR